VRVGGGGGGRGEGQLGRFIQFLGGAGGRTYVRTDGQTDGRTGVDFSRASLPPPPLAAHNGTTKRYQGNWPAERLPSQNFPTCDCKH